MTGKSNPFAATAVFMNRQKNLMIFNFIIFPSNLKKKKKKNKVEKKKKKKKKTLKSMRFFSILTTLFLNTLKSSSIYLKKNYWEAIMIVIWFICLHCLILESPASRVTWLVDFMQRKLIYHVMPNLLKPGVASQKTFTMQESFQINK